MTEPSRVVSYADPTLWPLVQLRWPAHEIPDAHLEHTYDELAKLLDRGELAVLVSFGDMHPHFTARQRQLIARFISTNHNRLALRCKGLAIVSEEADTRGLVTSLNWQSDTPFERGMFRTRGEALDWLRHRWEKFMGTPLRVQ